MNNDANHPLMKPYFSSESRAKIAEEIDEILSTGSLMFGRHTDSLEQGFADLVGVKHAISVNSCTTALTISLRHFGVAGGEVLVPSGSFVTDISSILFAEATPVLVDLDPDTLTFDLEDLERKITTESRAIVWVHLTGVISAKYKAFLKIAERHDLPVIEDAAHAHGSRMDNKVAGSIGHVGCFSFYPTKIMTSGTGGMLTTNDDELAEFAKELRIFGKDLKSGAITRLGNDWFLDEIRACIAYNQLLDLPEMLRRRRKVAKTYQDVLANQPGIHFVDVPENSEPAYYQFAIILENGIDVVTLRKRLKSEYRIDAKNIYKATHEEPIFRQFDKGDLAQTKRIMDHSLCLPMHPGVTMEDTTWIAETLVKELRKVI
ncbi:MAG: DegT/DnrJ/EryC1/StrS family aminotransferase [Rhodospirillaceae bacterium]|nr:DegT/DnrJ/EryC1/StrS family aminotransferase [Rhodospirillaceae bacterium]